MCGWSPCRAGSPLCKDVRLHSRVSEQDYTEASKTGWLDLLSRLGLRCPSSLALGPDSAVGLSHCAQG